MCTKFNLIKKKPHGKLCDVPGNVVPKIESTFILRRTMNVFNKSMSCVQNHNDVDLLTFKSF